MSKYRKFIEKCHPELLQEADNYVNCIGAKESVKRQHIKQMELDATRKRVPWYKFPFPNMAEAPRSHWPFDSMLIQLKTDEKTFMDRFMDFLYNPDSIDYIKSEAPDDADTEDMCWDGSLYAYKATGIYKSRPMMACIKDWIKAMHFEW